MECLPKDLQNIIFLYKNDIEFGDSVLSTLPPVYPHMPLYETFGAPVHYFESSYVLWLLGVPPKQLFEFLQITACNIRSFYKDDPEACKRLMQLWWAFLRENAYEFDNVVDALIIGLCDDLVEGDAECGLDYALIDPRLRDEFDADLIAKTSMSLRWFLSGQFD